MARAVDMGKSNGLIAGLTPQQHKVLIWVRDFIKQHGWSPSLREIQDACEFSSTSFVMQLLLQLQERDFITRVPSRRRSIGVTALGMQVGRGES